MTSADACDRCLRRAYLVAFLAPRIAGLLDRPTRRVPGLLGLSDDDLMQVAGGADPNAARAYLAALSLERERERLQRVEVTATCRHSAAYPRRIGDLDDPPAALFVRGQTELLARAGAEPTVAIVGTRRPSSYGSEVAYALGRGLGAAGVTVVSGLALGIDGTAHRGCLDAGGAPLAVLACGPDVPYPRRHRGLYRQIVAAGLVVSELPPGAAVFRWSFPARNRIMAALADLTLLVEAAQPSGSMITADFARDLGRSVAAVPGQVTARMAAGTNALLRDGAVPITCAQDVLDELFGVGGRTLRETAEPADERLRVVLEAMEGGRGVEEIAAVTGLTTPAVRAALGRLELGGWIVRRDLAGWERTAR
jgi:DNA processing protein